jgi:hypothetical protein
MMMLSRKLTLVATVSLLFPLTAAAENDYDLIDSKFKVYVGGFWPSLESKINIVGEVTPPGPPISIEDALGVDDSDAVAWGGVRWRISQRNSLEFEAFSLKRDGGESGTFSPPIQIGDTFIESGAIATSFDSSVARLTYGFSLRRSERMDLQLKAGLHMADLEVGFALSGNVCDPTTVPPTPPLCPAATTGAETQDVTAPLPHFGASLAYAFSPSVAVNFEVIGFAIEIDSIDGSILELDADVVWKPFENFGGGIGLRYFNTNVKASNSDLSGEFDYEYFGPVAYIMATF